MGCCYYHSNRTAPDNFVTGVFIDCIHIPHLVYQMIRNCFFFLDLSTFLDWPVFFHLFYILAISSAAGGRLCCQESGVDILTEPLFFKQHRRDHWQTHTLLKWDIILYVKVTIRCSTRISVDLFFFLTSSVKCMLMFFFLS